jgi:hypothetical protein
MRSANIADAGIYEVGPGRYRIMVNSDQRHANGRYGNEGPMPVRPVTG